MPALGGAYLLWIIAPRAVRFATGALGEVALGRGGLVYCGSARRGLAARLLRHLCRARGLEQKIRSRVAVSLGEADAPARPKRLRWHIDYLLEQPEARVVGVTYLPDAHLECQVGGQLQDELGARPAWPGFGASDCTAGCGAHLLRLPRRHHPAARRSISARVPGARHVGPGES